MKEFIYLMSIVIFIWFVYILFNINKVDTDSKILIISMISVPILIILILSKPSILTNKIFIAWSNAIALSIFLILSMIAIYKKDYTAMVFFSAIYITNVILFLTFKENEKYFFKK